MRSLKLKVLAVNAVLPVEKPVGVQVPAWCSKAWKLNVLLRFAGTSSIQGCVRLT